MSPHQEIVALLQGAMGFDPVALSDSAVVRAVRRRMQHCGREDQLSYLVYLRASPLELSQLIEEIVVPETWFFRDGQPFEWLKRFVIEEWLPANPDRPLRLLSVPCSSGEEPYSLVMALLDAGMPVERIQVDAVDISQVALGKARRGLYGRNSFRNVARDLQERYFTPKEQGWLLHEAVRRPVHFSQGNILALEFPLGRSAYDVIFCRNLLIYFDEANRERALATLEKLLLPRGLLFVGHAESAPVLHQWFASVGIPQTFAYRRKGEATRAQPQPVPVAASPRPPAPAKAPPPASPPPSVQDRLDDARRLADQGRLTEAARACETLLQDQGPTADAYYLLGLIHDAGRDGTKAQDCLGKAVYLQPDHHEALVHLALLAEREGRSQEAGRWRQRAQRVAQRRGIEA